MSVREPKEITCPNCGNKYVQLTNHWHQSSNCNHHDIPEKLLDILRACNVFKGYINKGKKYPIWSFESPKKAKVKTLRAIFGIFGSDIVVRQREDDWRGENREFENAIFSTIPHYIISASNLHPDQVRHPRLFFKTSVLMFGFVHSMGADGSAEYITLDVPQPKFSDFIQHCVSDYYTFEEGNRVRCNFKLSNIFHLHEVDFPSGRWNREHIKGDVNDLPQIKKLDKTLRGEVV
jgi:hypothetical protein